MPPPPPAEGGVPPPPPLNMGKKKKKRKKKEKKIKKGGKGEKKCYKLKWIFLLPNSKSFELDDAIEFNRLLYPK